MDIKHGHWYGAVKVTGIGNHQRFEGSITMIMRESIAWLMDARVAKNAEGRKEIVVTFSDSQTIEELGQNDIGIDPQIYAELVDRIRMATPEEEAQMEAEEQRRKDYPDWIRFKFLQASQRNFELSPDEYVELRNKFESIFPDLVIPMKRRSF